MNFLTVQGFSGQFDPFSSSWGSFIYNNLYYYIKFIRSVFQILLKCTYWRVKIKAQTFFEWLTIFDLNFTVKFRLENSLWLFLNYPNKCSEFTLLSDITNSDSRILSARLNIFFLYSYIFIYFLEFWFWACA